jgi:hypothetical protein
MVLSCHFLAFIYFPAGVTCDVSRSCWCNFWDTALKVTYSSELCIIYPFAVFSCLEFGCDGWSLSDLLDLKATLWIEASYTIVGTQM